MAQPRVRNMLDEVCLGVVSFLENHFAVAKVDVLDRIPVVAQDIRQWEDTNYPYKLPDDLKSLLLLSDGFDIKFFVRGNENIQQLGWIHMNGLSSIQMIPNHSPTLKKFRANKFSIFQSRRCHACHCLYTIDSLRDAAELQKQQMDNKTSSTLSYDESLSVGDEYEDAPGETADAGGAMNVATSARRRGKKEQEIHRMIADTMKPNIPLCLACRIQSKDLKRGGLVGRSTLCGCPLFEYTPSPALSTDMPNLSSDFDDVDRAIRCANLYGFGSDVFGFTQEDYTMMACIQQEQGENLQNTKQYKRLSPVPNFFTSALAWHSTMLRVHRRRRRRRTEDEWNRLKAQMRMFDLDNSRQDGRVCLVYFTPFVHTPEVWFQDVNCTWHFLAPDFISYFRLLVTHLGLPYWCYMFTDIGVPLYVKQWMMLLARDRMQLDMMMYERLYSAPPVETVPIRQKFSLVFDEKSTPLFPTGKDANTKKAVKSVSQKVESNDSSGSNNGSNSSSGGGSNMGGMRKSLSSSSSLSNLANKITVHQKTKDSVSQKSNKTRPPTPPRSRSLLSSTSSVSTPPTRSFTSMGHRSPQTPPPQDSYASRSSSPSIASPSPSPTSSIGTRVPTPPSPLPPSALGGQLQLFKIDSLVKQAKGKMKHARVSANPK